MITQEPHAPGSATRFGKSQLFGVGLASWAIVGNLLPQPFRAFAVMVALHVIWLVLAEDVEWRRITSQGSRFGGLRPQSEVRRR
jgi:hypothetical protein